MAVDALVGSTIPSLVNGVSQQPNHLRLPSQAEDQVNCLSRIEDGVTRRPPTEWLAKLLATASPVGGYAIHAYESSDERYVILVEDGDVRVFDFEGNEATVNAPDGLGYLDFDSSLYDAREVFSAVTTADTTFILNRKKVVEMSGSVSASRPNEFILMVFADQSAQGTIITLEINSVQVDSQATSSGVGGGSTATSDVIDNLLANITGAGAFTNWTFTRLYGVMAGNASAIYGVQNTGSEEVVRIISNNGQDTCRLIYKKANTFAELPAQGQDGFLVEIVGGVGSADDNYWVEWDESEKAWVETTGAALDNSFDADTMPFKLTRQTVTPLVFEFAAVDWDDREKGDAVSAPEPSFVGYPIADVVFHKNRFGLVADEGIVLSEANNFFNFWPTTVTTLVDSDPIDTTGSNNRVAILDWAVPFDERLLLFSAHGGIQNELQAGDAGDGALTGKSATVVEKSAYDNSSQVRPVALGRRLYFVVERVTASGVMEYTTVAQDHALVDEVTGHIPTYVPGNIIALTGSETENTLIALSGDQPGSLWVYRYFFLNNEKVQSSWSEWTLGADDVILAVKFLRTVVFIVVERPDGIHLVKADLRKLEDGDLGFRLCLDMQYELSGGVYSAGVTTWTVPFTIDDTEDWRLVLSDAGWGSNLSRTLTNADFSVAGSVSVAGDYSAYPVRIGRAYESAWEPSTPVIDPSSTERNASAAPTTLGRLQLKGWTFLFKDTASFVVSVSRYDDDTNSDTYQYTYSGYTIGGPVPVGPITLREGKFRVRANGEARHVRVRVTSSAVSPFTLVGAEWEGRYISRAARV